MNSDLEIAQSVTPKPIVEIAEAIGLDRSQLELYGEHVAKIKLDVLAQKAQPRQSKYIDVTAITPTPLGEGKTVTTIGLSLGLNRIGHKAICTLRQPSLGPVFGIKGGAAGGGYSQVIPMEEFNLHLTGDFHAVSAANNLLAAFIDNHVQKGNELGIDPFTISWKRVVDVNDRSLRNVVTGLGNKRANGIPRETGFDITAASEIMAVLALAGGLMWGLLWVTDHPAPSVTADMLPGPPEPGHEYHVMMEELGPPDGDSADGHFGDVLGER